MKLRSPTAYFARRGTCCWIDSANRQFLDAKAQPGNSDGKVVVKIVSIENIAKWLDAGIEDDPAAEGAKPVSGIGVAESGSKANQGSVQQPTTDLTVPRGIKFSTAGEAPGALNVIKTLIQCREKRRYGFNTIFAVPVDKHESIVILVDGIIQQHTHLRAQFAWTCFH